MKDLREVNVIITIKSLYLDELIIFRSNIDVMNVVKSLLCNNFDMKDLGEVNWILGIKITRSEKGIYSDQSHYVEKILNICKFSCIHHMILL